jgi:hypothetical protein
MVDLIRPLSESDQKKILCALCGLKRPRGAGVR